MAAEVFSARLARANLITKTNFDAQLKKITDRVTSNKTKHLLVEAELKKLNTFDAAYYRDKNYFEEDGTQNYLVFRRAYKYFEDVDASKTIVEFHANSWMSKGLSSEKSSSVNGFKRPFIKYTNSRIKLKFDESVLRQKLSTSLGLIANYYIVYRLSQRTNRELFIW